MEEQEETRKFEVPDHRESRGRGRGKPSAAPFAVRNAPWHQSVRNMPHVFFFSD